MRGRLDATGTEFARCSRGRRRPPLRVLTDNTTGGGVAKLATIFQHNIIKRDAFQSLQPHFQSESWPFALPCRKTLRCRGR
jgi:hypothetical protein